MKQWVVLLFSVCLTLILKGQKQYLLAGTYTENSTSKGISVYRFDTLSGKATAVSQFASINPSYLALSKNGNYVYCVNESDPGKLSSYSFNSETGELSRINTVSSNGSAPCYIEIDKTGNWLFCGNYSSGNLSVYPINKNGSIGDTKQVIHHEGSGPDKDRQEAPHVHSTVISPDNKFLFVPDLGIDKVMIYPFDAATGRLSEAGKSFATVIPGGGPRHIVFSKNGKFAYLIEEMSGRISVFSYKKGKLSRVQTINKLPQGLAGAGADIHLSPDGKFLYASQRSNSTIQIFRVRPKDGKISFIESQSTLGNFPRNFTIHPTGNFLLAANQRSNDIRIFRINKTTGLLTDTGHKILLDKPVCLKWNF